jgi:hypothetical protein
MNPAYFFFRRFDLSLMNDKFISALNKSSERCNEIKKNYPQSLDWFKNYVIANLIMSLGRTKELEINDGTYHSIHQYLKNHYSDEIEERWNELQEFDIRESVLRVLREERLPIKVLRRTNEIDREFKRLMGSVYRPDNVCEYRDGSELFEVVTEAILENLYFNTFYGVDDLSNEWEKIADFIGNYTWEKYGKEVLDYYKDNCNSNKMETNESELTERCWAGYTQKGMKTMFGKRYPNCVKKKKK